MIPKVIASGIMAAVLNSAKKELLETAKSQIIKSQKEALRKDLLAKVTAQYTKEAEHNFTQYIQALESANVEISFEGKPGQAFINKAQSAVNELESYLDNQNPDGAVIQFLKKRYGEEGINIITGRLYAGHYVGKKSQGVYEVANKMGYAAPVDKRKPWLSSEKTTQGLEDMLANAAKEIFELTFEDLDLSSDIALLKFSGQGFKPPQKISNKPPKGKSSPKKKKKK
jgi:hypothetical protein